MERCRAVFSLVDPLLHHLAHLEIQNFALVPRRPRPLLRGHDPVGCVAEPWEVVVEAGAGLKQRQFALEHEGELADERVAVRVDAMVVQCPETNRAAEAL
jgi:hypothetical protein